MKKQHPNLDSIGLEKTINLEALAVEDELSKDIHSLSEQEINILERKIDLFGKIKREKKGFILLFCCLSVYGILISCEYVFSNIWDWEVSNTMQGYTELLKFMVSTLVGYLFSETKKK